MIDSDDRLFAFDFVDFRFIEVTDHLSYPPQLRLSNHLELRLLGRITKGRIAMGDSILVPTANGPITGTVNQFWETFDDWLGLPFYTALTPEALPDQFCICIAGISSEILPSCPGTAHPAPYADEHLAFALR